MKKAVSLLFAALFLLSLASCSESGRTAFPGGGKTVGDVLRDGTRESDAAPETAAPAKTDSPVTEARTEGPEAPPRGDVDVDLSALSSTLVYSEVYNMMLTPDDYLGKKVRMRGQFTYGLGEDRYYFACIVSDATACCSQGLEFVLADERAFPDEYPEVGSEITVVGVFDVYSEGAVKYCQLADAEIEE